MGCGGSKVQNEEGITRCRRRKKMMRQAVRYRNQLAVAHTEYLGSLRTVGTAFRQFTDGEFREQVNLSSSSSSSSTPIPATPTTPPPKPEEEEEIIHIVRHAKPLRSNPSRPITVVVSPPQSPERRRNTGFSKEDEEAYRRYMEADAPPEGLYSDIMPPGKTHGTSSSRVAQPATSYSYTYSDPGSSSGSFFSGYSPYMIPESTAPSWDIFGIFQMPPMMMHQNFHQVIEEDEEEPPVEEEEIPALETASPPHAQDESSPIDEDESPSDIKETSSPQVEEDTDHDHDNTDDEKVVYKEAGIPKKKVEDIPKDIRRDIPKLKKMEDEPYQVPRVKEEIYDHKVHDDHKKVDEIIKQKKVDEIIRKVEDEIEAKVDEELQKKKKKEKKKEVMIEVEDPRDIPSSSDEPKDVASSSGTTVEARMAAKDIPREDSPKVAPPAKNKDLELWDVLRIIEKEFKRASEFGGDMTRLLEARKMNHGSGLGFGERSAKIFRAVSRTQWSPRTPLSFSEDSSSEDFGGATKHALGGHATTLDKLFAWEKKLYIEVKENDSISSNFERKRKQLHKLDTRGASSESIDKIRVDIKMLETQLQVSMQAMKATSQAIQELTDKELFHQLQELLEATMIMWKNMYHCHERQKDATERIKPAGSPPLEATSNSHRLATQQLESALIEWQKNFGLLVGRQREYMRSLNSWLRLSIYTPERKSESLKRPPVHTLCSEWTNILEKDKEHEKELVDNIKSFAGAIHNIVRQQEEESRAQRRAEGHAKELSRKTLALNNAERKLVGDGSAVEEAKASLEEKRVALEMFRARVEVEKEGFTKAMQITRKMTLEILQMGLPKVFDSLAVFSESCLKNYKDLHHRARNKELDTD